MPDALRCQRSDGVLQLAMALDIRMTRTQNRAQLDLWPGPAAAIANVCPGSLGRRFVGADLQPIARARELGEIAALAPGSGGGTLHGRDDAELGAGRQRRLDLRYETGHDIAAPAQEGGKVAIEGEIGQQPARSHEI